MKDIDWGKPLKSFPSKYVYLLYRTFQPFSPARAPKKYSGLPQPLSDLYDPKYKTWSLEDLRNVEIDMSISDEEQIAVREATKI